MLEFGSLLRVLRSDLHLTQTEMAELLFISQPVYSRMEAGVRPIPVKALERLADRRHISVQALFLAYLFLDENLAVIEGGVRDEASLALLELAAKYRQRFPQGFKHAAALGLLYEAAGQ
ncbi:MAG TPA: helix-turn-helix transcriptional regulator [Parvularculaceae bacterium]|nr:helix-turn-helix transcriptional regulator [Amphiplicatus sp.]HPE30939.1 helix-turn-helix transcriptional regulator [Parvularculaceae bacterium]HRX38280.1 helix-turn-helix transcriptional regulator [Parvularculaceae bacterium]